MAATREDEQRRRAEGRERRRDRDAGTDAAAKPERTSSDGGDSDGSSTRNEPQQTLKHAAMTAVAGAIAAGLAGAGTAWLNRRRNEAPAVEREAPGEPEAVAHDEAKAETDDTQSPEPEATQQRQSEETPEADEDEPAEPELEHEPEAGAEEDDEGPQAVQDEPAEERAEPEAEEQAGEEEPTEEPETDDAPAAEAETETEPEDDRAPERQPTSAGEARSMADEARDQLEQLLGMEAEAVTGFERSDGHWSVTVDVVELHRIPDSMDILASYEVVLDDDRNLVSFERTRRYHRAQVENDG